MKGGGWFFGGAGEGPSRRQMSDVQKAHVAIEGVARYAPQAADYDDPKIMLDECRMLRDLLERAHEHLAGQRPVRNPPTVIGVDVELAKQRLNELGEAAQQAASTHEAEGLLEHVITMIARLDMAENSLHPEPPAQER